LGRQIEKITFALVEEQDFAFIPVQNATGLSFVQDILGVYRTTKQPCCAPSFSHAMCLAPAHQNGAGDAHCCQRMQQLPTLRHANPRQVNLGQALSESTLR